MAIITHNSPTAPTRINNQRKSTIGSGFTWMGFIIDTDEQSLRNIMGRVSKILAMKALGQPIDTFAWRTADDSTLNFTADAFLEMAIAIDNWVENQYIDSWQKKANL